MMSAAQFASDHFMELVIGGVIVLAGLCVFFCVSATVIVCAWRWRQRSAINSDATPIITEYGNEDNNINETQLVYQSQNDTQPKSEPESQQKDDEPTTTQPDSSKKQQCNEPPTTSETEEEDYSVIRLDQISITEQAEYIKWSDQAGSAPTITAPEYANINTSKQTTAPVLSSEDQLTQSE